MTLLLNSPAASQTGILLFWIVIMFAFMYFMVIRPQKKEDKKRNVNYIPIVIVVCAFAFGTFGGYLYKKR